VKRRSFILGFGSAAAWPVVVRAQPSERVRRVGVLLVWDQMDRGGAILFASFSKGLAELGWIDGRNLRTEVRWSAGNRGRMDELARELLSLQPELVFAGGTPATLAFQRETRTIPIVFTSVSDPVGSGFVASLSRPGGNITGFIQAEASMAGKWVELLTQIVPGVRQAAIAFNPDTAPNGGKYYLPSFEAAARSLGVAPITAPVRSDAEVESAMISLAHTSGGVMVLMPDAFAVVHTAQIVMLAAKYAIPVISWYSEYVRKGGLLSYGPNYEDLYRRPASYVDRILLGAKPADLPVQLPIKFELAINLKTAKALGVNIPQSILLTADEIIE
jgi:putative tryptophan/tyrosine transport system substrate-binding protein